MSTENQQPTKSTAVRKFTEDTVDGVLGKLNTFQTEGNLKLPKNYNPEGALRSALLIIQETQDLNKRPALEVCTKESVATALLDMALQGLSPTKKQCYFIVYGNKLVMQRSYQGTIAIAKRVAGVKEVNAFAIYEGDQIEFTVDLETGRRKVTKHEQKFENINPEKTKGAYAVAIYEDGTTEYEIMTRAQVEASWGMGNAKGNSPAHKKFPDEMAKKSVISRLLKTKIGGSDDADLFDEEDAHDPTGAYVKNEVQTKANKKQIRFDDVEDAQIEEEQKSVQDPKPEPSQEEENQRAYDEALAEEAQGQQTLGPQF